MNLSYVLWVFVLSTLPIFELRLSLPLAIVAYDIPWYVALPVCFLGNIIPALFLLWFLEPITNLCKKVSILAKILDWIFERSRRRAGIVEKYGPIGLVLLVSIPLPVTGAWTGSIIAFLLRLPFQRAFPAIVLGVLIAGIIVTILSVLGLEVRWLLFSPEHG